MEKKAESLLDSFFGPPTWVHQLSCPCGATCKTDYASLASQFIDKHAGHKNEEPVLK